MSDLEAIARKFIEKNDETGAIDRITSDLLFYKDISEEKARKIAQCIYDEIKSTFLVDDKILKYPKANVTMHAAGVGCRGEGDFYVHKKLSEIADVCSAKLSVKDLDDAGAINSSKNYILGKIEGMHSRLSDYPYLAGFHVSRAALRDVYVKGGVPKALMIDVHLADDGDVGKLFDYVAGCATVCKLCEIPIISGSTLRIGGDLVIGDRLTGCVAAIGDAKNILARKNIAKNQVILMTSGYGGGTICTAAIYAGKSDIIKETLNLDFIKASKALFDSNLTDKIACMMDVTNGGLRNEVSEAISELNLGIELNADNIKPLINSKVFKLLEELNIDYLGVSLDSLLIFCNEMDSDEILKEIRAQNIKIEIVGKTISDNGLFLVENNVKRELKSEFRESAYTEIKKITDEAEIDLKKIDNAFIESKKKIDEISNLILGNSDATNSSR